MSSGLINRILIWLARKLHVSPGVAHVLLLCLMALLYGALEHRAFSSFGDPMFFAFFGGAGVIVVLFTWLTKGEYRKLWWKSEPWQR